MDREAIGEVFDEPSHAKIILVYMTNQELSDHLEYRSLTDIRLRKEALRKDIEADDAKIKALWSSIFTRPDAFSHNASRSKRVTSLISMGMGTLDGALLAWKLYRKFKRNDRGR